MKRCPLVSTAHIARVVCILLLAASVNAQNESWDSPLCTESALSVPRGSRAVMTCNISNTFADVSIWLEGQIIFNEAPQGNSRLDDWELQVQGGQARLMINDTQDVHTGLYLWQLHGHQRDYKNFTLTVSDPVKHFQQRARPDTLVGVVVAVILILGLTGIGALICHRHHRS
uniref:Secreted and transmembrane 1A n=1 Tax=Cricetulus griseus TaxID=10029 RepID=A0A8C2QG71_CRIGR